IPDAHTLIFFQLTLKDSSSDIILNRQYYSFNIADTIAKKKTHFQVKSLVRLGWGQLGLSEWATEIMVELVPLVWAHLLMLSLMVVALMFMKLRIFGYVVFTNLFALSLKFSLRGISKNQNILQFESMRESSKPKYRTL
ncbi:hypothetical protein ACJX0J_025519, partial [Zea mays]